MSTTQHAVTRDATHVGKWRVLALALAVVSWALIAWSIWMLV